MASNSSIVGTIVVLGTLYLAQGLIADWLTDDEIIDEDDIVAAAIVAELPSETTSCDPWILIFGDEFDGESANGEDWILYNSPAATGVGTRSPDAIEVLDGSLVITARLDDGEVLVGGMASNIQQTFGRFEARVRTGADPTETVTGVVSTWPAGNNHPDAGEISFYETLGVGEREPFYSYVHGPDGEREEVIHTASAQDWHEIAVEWSEDNVVMYRDGQRVGFVDESNVIPVEPHVLTLGLEVGEEPEDTEAFSEVQMFVDWVRVYRKNDSPGAGC